MKDPKVIGGWEWHGCFGGIGIGNSLDACVFVIDSRYTSYTKAKRYAQFIVKALNAATIRQEAQHD